MSTMRKIFGFALLGQVLAAQTPTDPAFFTADSKVLSARCTERAEKMAGRDTHVLAECGDVWLSLGDRARAEALFQKAAQHSNADGETFRLIGRAWMRHGFKAEALQAYATTSKAFVGSWDMPKNPMARAAADLLEGREVEEGSRLMERAYRLDTRDEDNCLHFALAALTSGQRDLAAAYFWKAIQAKPSSWEVMLEIARAHAALASKAPAAPAP